MALFFGDDAPWAFADAPAGQKTDCGLKMRIDRIIRVHGLNLCRQASIVLVAGAAADNLISINHGIYIMGECKNLAHVHAVIMLKTIPPHNGITLRFVPRRYPHEGQVWEPVVTIYIN